jgi:hypothetical protein
MSRSCAAGARPGFSFAEILFAVMILGIGFIMVAAIFPVAIAQTAQSTEDTTAAANGEAAVDYVSKLATTKYIAPTAVPTQWPDMLPPTASAAAVFGTPPLQPPPPPGSTVGGVQSYGEVWSFREDQRAGAAASGRLIAAYGITRTDWGVPWTGATNANPLTATPYIIWQALSGSQIFPADHRYGWVGFYRRDVYWDSSATPTLHVSPFAQIIVIATRVRNGDTYQSEIDLQRWNNGKIDVANGKLANLEPALRVATVYPNNYQNGTPSTIQFDFTTVGIGDENRVASGMYVVVSDDNLPANQFHGKYNGRILQLGNFRADLTTDARMPTYELPPGYGLKASSDPTFPSDYTLNNAWVYIVGKGYADPRNPQQGAAGLPQDSAVYTTFIRVN